MPGSCGKNVLLELSTDAGVTFVPVAGLRTKSYTISGDTVDTTNSDSGGFMELLNCAPRGMSLSAAGLLLDAAIDQTMLDLALSGDIVAARFTQPGFATITTNIQLTSYQSDNPYADAITFDVSLQSSGTITKVAA